MLLFFVIIYVISIKIILYLITSSGLDIQFFPYVHKTIQGIIDIDTIFIITSL